MLNNLNPQQEYGEFEVGKGIIRSMSRLDLLIELKGQINRSEYKELGLMNLNFLRLEIEREIEKEGTKE